MTTDDGGFERDLATALREVVPDDLRPAGLATRVPAIARRRRTTRRTVLAAAGVLALASGLAALPGGPLRGDATPALPPPAVDPTGPHLVIEPAVVPPGTAVAVFVRSSGGFGTYGLGGSVERWTGSAWQDVGLFAPSGAVSLFAQTFFEHGGSGMVVPDLGLQVREGGTGHLEWVDLTGLDPGTYRLGHRDNDGVAAWGTVEIRDGAPAGPELRPWLPDQKAFLTTTEAVPAATPTPVQVGIVVVDRDGTQSADDIDRALGEVRPTLTVERWDGGAWVPLADALVLTPVPDTVRSYTVDLPALDAGTYRLRGTSSVAGDLFAPFWVLD